MIGIPVTDEELDTIESIARSIIEAVDASDLDTAYILASTCPEPAMLAMIMAELTKR